jgi:uncharacterized membrane protein YjfL (UPF0719 family)
MEDLINIKYLASAVVFSAIGLIAFVISYVALDLMTPRVSIWKELVEKQNIAVAIFLGAVTLGIATIIASAIHG